MRVRWIPRKSLFPRHPAANAGGGIDVLFDATEQARRAMAAQIVIDMFLEVRRFDGDARHGIVHRPSAAGSVSRGVARVQPEYVGVVELDLQPAERGRIGFTAVRATDGHMRVAAVVDCAVRMKDDRVDRTIAAQAAQALQLDPREGEQRRGTGSAFAVSSRP